MLALSVLIFKGNVRSLRTVACIALSWNDNVLSAYHIAFAGECKRGRKQCDFAPQTQSILFQNSLFS